VVQGHHSSHQQLTMKEIKNEQDFADLCLALEQNNSEPMGHVWLQFYPSYYLTLDDTRCIRFGHKP
jgi:hypothetical protein